MFRGDAREDALEHGSETMAEAYIVAATRTAGGRKGGKLKDWHPADLGAVALNDLLARTGIDPAAVEDVIMGCVQQVGEQSTNIARNAVLASKLPESVPATSVDQVRKEVANAKGTIALLIQRGDNKIFVPVRLK